MELDESRMNRIGGIMVIFNRGMVALLTYRKISISLYFLDDESWSPRPTIT